MNATGFELLLRETIGLDPSTIGSAAIARAIRACMKVGGITELDHYESELRTSKTELQELIERIVVPETSFFRDHEAFAMVSRLASGEWKPTSPNRIRRLVSLPCSTGEEPYSLAMTLLDAGLSEENFHIDAIDISRRALERAQAGLYGKNSFRAEDLAYRSRYFDETSAGWQIREQLRRQVHFARGNLIDKNLLSEVPGYDVIFCRNVMIYLDPESRDRVVQSLERLLLPDGILFVGPAEASLLPTDRFASIRVAHTFAFRKRKSAAATQALPKRKKRPAALFPVAPVAAKAPFRSATRSLPKLAPVQTDLLEKAVRLADEGNLAEASLQAEAHIRQHGPSAQAYCLQGLIHDSAGQKLQAEEFYRKALYLDPQNEEALAHLASLLDSRGQTQNARLLFERAKRITRQPK